MIQNTSITKDMLDAVRELNDFVNHPAIAEQFDNAARQALALLKKDDIYSVINMDLSDLKIEAPSLLGTLRIAAFRRMRRC